MLGPKVKDFSKSFYDFRTFKSVSDFRCFQRLIFLLNFFDFVGEILIPIILFIQEDTDCQDCIMSIISTIFKVIKGPTRTQKQ